MQLTSVIPRALNTTFMLFASKIYLDIHFYCHNKFQITSMISLSVGIHNLVSIHADCLIQWAGDFRSSGTLVPLKLSNRSMVVYYLCFLSLSFSFLYKLARFYIFPVYIWLTVYFRTYQVKNKLSDHNNLSSCTHEPWHLEFHLLTKENLTEYLFHFLWMHLLNY